MEQKLPRREEVPVELTWRLEDVYENETLFEKDLEIVEAMTAELAKMRDSVTQNAANLLHFLTDYEKMSERLYKAYSYAMMANDVDTANQKTQAMKMRVMSLSVKVSTDLAFFEPAVLALPEGTIEVWYKEEPGLLAFQVTIREILRGRAHSRSAEVEELLASAGEMAASPEDIYSMFIDADLKFPEVVDAEGNRIQITNGRFVPLEESTDRNLRKEAFRLYYETYKSFENALAAMFSAQVKQLRFYAAARKYPSTFEAAVDRVDVSPAVCDNLIEAVHDNLDKMHAYVRLRRKMLGVDELHMYDVYAPMVPDATSRYTIDEAKALVIEAMAPLGSRYQDLLREAFSNRWVDVVENEGKRGGAYSNGVYGVHPYVLLNYNNRLDDVFTLAHEMGHSMHSYFSSEKLSLFDSDYKIFVAEVASTCNEVLLMEYMLGKVTEKRERMALINHFLESFKGTVYRQTMFGEFERKANRMAEEGEVLTAESLYQTYYALNQQYFGPDMVSDELIGYEWSRIPHFYYNFYVYQYATSFCAAVAIARRILAEGQPAVDAYLEFLSSGCTKDPVSLLKIAGVDLGTKEPIEQALKLFEELIQEMEALTD